MQTRDHGEAEARHLIALAEAELGLADWTVLTKGDWRKSLVAGIVRRRSLVDNGWLVEQLDMGARNAVSRTIRLARNRIQQDRKASQLARRLEKKIAQE